VRQLRDIRRRRGFSQADLATEAGVSEFTISEIEAGKRENPRPSTLRKLAEALGVTVADLYGEPFDSPKGAAPPSLADWLEERCGHAYLALSKGEIETLFDNLGEAEDQRRALGLKINDEYNVFVAFPSNVDTEERVLMRKTIRSSISQVAVNHGVALHESGLYPEYADQVSRIFEMELPLDADIA
jgi:transcriptional regulator with XRE-family HTH domain